jgi:hypothetical protein
MWFHADNATPIDPLLARSLEEGYTAMRAWSSTYADELSSALSLDQAEDKLRWKVRDDVQGREIFFISGTEAWIVPLAGVVKGLFGNKNILKGLMEKWRGGTKVIRGWNNLTCELPDVRSKDPIVYTDLILVIHGIGQKLSERGNPLHLPLTSSVESFGFTYATNRLRSNLNRERESDQLKDSLRPSYRPCVLPINWRARLSFDFDVPPSRLEHPNPTKESVFTYKDLQPNSISVVRDLIKDVMLDIPYYLSSHKQRILEAVVEEANRVYHVFSKCNPEFDGKGRTHIIGHSLGCVIATDVLSTQPTYIASDTFHREIVHFAFDTTNLYCVGSPVGLFMM